MSGTTHKRLATAILTKIHRVLEYGYPRDNGTVETISSVFLFTLNDRHGIKESQPWYNLEEEIENAKHLSTYELGQNWEDKFEEEEYHYESLRYAMLHQIRKVFYFHPKETIESRKFIIFSDDCISSIQFLVRRESVTLMVHMRSSDLVRLFTTDTIFLCCLLKELIEEHKIDISKRSVELQMTIGSAHIQEKDREVAKNAQY